MTDDDDADCQLVDGADRSYLSLLHFSSLATDVATAKEDGDDEDDEWNADRQDDRQSRWLADDSAAVQHLPNVSRQLVFETCRPQAYEPTAADA